ncbi:MAG: ATP-binding protein [Anaerolineae bacterium]
MSDKVAPARSKRSIQSFRPGREQWRIWNELVLAINQAHSQQAVLDALVENLLGFGINAIIGRVNRADDTLTTVVVALQEPELQQDVERLTNSSSLNYTLPLESFDFRDALVRHNQPQLITVDASFVRSVLPPDLDWLAERLVRRIGPAQGIVVALYTRGSISHLLFAISAGLNEDDVPMLTAFAELTSAALDGAALLEEAEAQRNVAETLQRVGYLVNTSLNLNRVLELILGQLATVIPYDSAAIFLEENDQLSLVAGQGFRDKLLEVLKIAVPVEDNALYQEIQERSEPVYIEDVRYDDRYTQWAGSARVRSWIGLPLISKDKIIGQIAIDSHHPSAYSPDDINLAFTFAQHVAIAIENARLHETVREYATTLERRVEERTATIRREQEQTAAILKGAGDAIVITDRDGVIAYINPAFSELTGYTSEEAVGHKTSILRSKKTSLEFYKNMWNTILMGQTWRGELQNRRKDGTIYDAELTIAPIRDEEGQIVNFVGIQRDVSKAKELDRLKTEFLATAAHELRSPLTTIRGYAELLIMRDDISGPETKEFLSYIYEQSLNLTDLVSDLLDLARIESGELFTISPEPVDIQPLLANIVEQWQLKAPAHTFELVGPSTWPEVEVDKVRIQQVFDNLLSNAVKYSPDGGKITVETHEGPANMRFSVTDEGKGISEEEQKHLFEKFWRADATSTAVEGIGLGLVVVKTIVEAHGGRIWIARSRPGEGTTISFTIPLRDRIPTILIIEDERGVLEVEERILSAGGYKTLSATYGMTGLGLARSELPDLIVLDLMLPDMSGEEILHQLRQQSATRDIPVVVVSAKSALSHIENTYSLGAVDFLTKPFDFDEFLGRIRLALKS